MNTSYTEPSCPLVIEDYIQATSIFLMCVVGIITNIVVIILVFTRPILPRNQRWAIGNLAFLDCCFAFTGLFFRFPVFFVTNVCSQEVPGVSSWCVVSSFLLGVFGYINTLALLPITIDRFVVFWRPIHYHFILDKFRFKLLIFVMWVPNVIFAIIEILAFTNHKLKIDFSPYIGTCIYHIYIESYMKEIICLALPSIIIMVMYIGILFNIMQSKRFSAGKRTSRRLTAFQMRLLKTPLIIMTICAVTSSMYVIAKYCLGDNFRSLIRFGDAIFLINVVTNPIIYIFRIPNIRKYLKYDYWVENRHTNQRRLSSTPAALVFSLRRRSFMPMEPRHSVTSKGSLASRSSRASRVAKTLTPITSEEDVFVSTEAKLDEYPRRKRVTKYSETPTECIDEEVYTDGFLSGLSQRERDVSITQSLDLELTDMLSVSSPQRRWSFDDIFIFKYHLKSYDVKFSSSDFVE